MGSRGQGSFLEVGNRSGGMEMAGGSSRIFDSFGYLQRLLQGLFVGRVRRIRAEVLYRLRR